MIVEKGQYLLRLREEEIHREMIVETVETGPGGGGLIEIFMSLCGQTEIHHHREPRIGRVDTILLLPEGGSTFVVIPALADNIEIRVFLHHRIYP